jgi:cyclophilin family peptidyl-prolyl cis-trans isomerase
MRRLICCFTPALVALVIALMAPASPAFAEESETPAPKPGKAKTESGKSKQKPDAGDKKRGAESERSWADLIARRREMIKEIDKLRRDGSRANDAKREELAVRLKKLGSEFEREIAPQIQKLSPQVNKSDPTDPDAAEFVAGQALTQNKFADVIQTVGPVLKAKKSTPVLLNMLGLAHFATHEFSEALSTFETARTADEQLFEQFGRRFYDECEKYVAYWEKEQQIRDAESKADDLPRVLFKTTKGEITLELFENEAPNTVANFISLVESKAYDGTLFHRVLPNFMAQGGDPYSLDGDPKNDGMGGPGYTIPCECYTEKARMHFQGSLSMAHAGRDTGGSQFFLTHLPTAHLNWEKDKEGSSHTVFGRVIKGLDLALSLEAGDSIESASVLRKRPHEYVPKKTSDRGTKAGSKKKQKREEND